MQRIDRLVSALKAQAMAAIPATIREIACERADRRCEYCRKSEGISVYPHHIEHIILRKHGGSSSQQNLAWACSQCNVAKGTDVASYDVETGKLVPLFNPRLHRWDEHLDLVEDKNVGKTPTGRMLPFLPNHRQAAQNLRTR